MTSTARHTADVRTLHFRWWDVLHKGRSHIVCTLRYNFTFKKKVKKINVSTAWTLLRFKMNIHEHKRKACRVRRVLFELCFLPDASRLAELFSFRFGFFFIWVVSPDRLDGLIRFWSTLFHKVAHSWGKSDHLEKAKPPSGHRADMNTPAVCYMKTSVSPVSMERKTQVHRNKNKLQTTGCFGINHLK